LKKAVFQRIKSYRGGAYVLAVVGARAKKDPATGRNPAKYAHLVEGGTRPHRIPKLPGKRLKFDAGGALIIRAAVAHPGGAAQRPLERAYRTSKPEALRNFRGKFAAEVIAEAKRA
jgi:hypothetical protein